MRILRTYYRLPPIVGGMEKHIRYLSLLQNRTHEVTIFYNRGESVSVRDEQILKKIKLDRISPQFIRIFIFYISIITKLIFKKKKFDVVHIHGDWSSLLFSSMLKRITNSKIIVFTYHGMVTNSKFHEKVLSIFAKGADLIFATGNDAVLKIKNLARKDVIFQPSGINDIFFIQSLKVPKSKSFRIITVANLVKVKNLELVILIAEKLPSISFEIVGTGPEKEKLDNMILEKKLNNITLLGYKSHEEVKELYDSSDCFLLTSIAEGTPTSALEAMACGQPIISSNAGGIDHIIKGGENGFVAYGYDPETYVNFIKRLVESPELCSTISEKNRLKAEDYRWENVAGNITAKTLECYNKKMKM